MAVEGNKTEPVASAPSLAIGTFPYTAEDKARLVKYDYYNRLFLGAHFDAFKIQIDDERYNRAYNKLRYLVVNFAGLLSKITADMLFSEPISVKVPNGDQDWVDAFWRENKMDIQCYESALSNSYNGDALWKLRTGKINPGDDKVKAICEDVTPKIFFPKVNSFNVRQRPEEIKLAWSYKLGADNYLREEIHSIVSNTIENRAYLLKGEQIINPVSLETAGLTDIQPVQATGINRPLIEHIPNWKTGERYFGLSDYLDLDSLFYALNNRMTKVDNILDKHGDPILMVPAGILDEKGQVNKKAMGVIEIADGADNKPEYIVWDASLDNAFKEVEKMVDFLYLTAEISPDLLGLGQGVSDSGRALKFKLMRTLAKTARKRLYYDQAIKEMVYTAQVLAKQYGLYAGDKQFSGEPVMPEIDWKDGLPIDNHEAQADAIQAIDAGILSKKEAIMNLYDVDEKTAQERMTQVEDEQPTVEMPTSNIGDSFPVKK